MKYYYKYLLIILFCTSGFLSCKKFVEVKAPKTQLLSEYVFDNAKSAETALAGMYAQMRDFGFLTAESIYGTVVPLALYTDEAKYLPQDNSDSYQFYKNILSSTKPGIRYFWTYPYQTIFFANSILEGVQKSQNLTPEEKNQYMGEALVVRSIVHFYLTNTYGNIPYVVSTDYRQTKDQGKMATNEVYQLCIKDLMEAEGLLGATYPVSERIRPNKWVAGALLARVYLYKKDWKNAEIKSSEIINHSTLYGLEDDLDKVFLKGSKEAIWQFTPKYENGNTFEGQNFIITQDPYLQGFVLNPEFVNAHEPGDLRKEKWLGSITIAGVTWLYPFKYKQGIGSESGTLEYSVLLRLAEQYLIRSEAFAQQDNFEASLKDLNKIRHRANLDNIVFTSRVALLDAILKERRIELFMEFGHRFYDLKRTGNASKYLQPIKNGWTENSLLWPIPLSELEANKNLLPQNPGYN